VSADTQIRRRGGSPAARGHPGPLLRLARGLGWTCIAAGIVVLLYLVYSLFFTGYQTEAAQRELLREFTAGIGQAPAQDPAGAEPSVDPEATEPPVGGGAPADASPRAAEPDGATPQPAIELGSAVAAIEFVRPGATGPPLVHDGPLLVVEGVTRQALTRGPGHYPDTEQPGQPGNFAVAGHRTTYGAPFFHLDQLTSGDEVHVTDRSGAVHVYRVAEQRIVTPADVEVLGDDPRGTGVPTLTLTTCHPRFSAAQRMVVFAELVA